MATSLVPTPLPFSERALPKTLCLFDVDETLSKARQHATPEMLALLAQLRKKCAIGFVGGSDLKKIREQISAPDGTADGEYKLGQDRDLLDGLPERPVPFMHLLSATDIFDYGFAENGLIAYRMGKALASQSFIGWLGEEKYKKMVKFCLRYISELDIPIMRGTFIEFRNGMINISPIGRNATIEERNTFEAYDKQHNIRPKFVQALKDNFGDYGLTFSIGGQISFDVFPCGWDKTFALSHVEKDGWEEIHFFGDKTYQGGNDYEIFSDPRTIGHTVEGPSHTMQLLKEIFSL